MLILPTHPIGTKKHGFSFPHIPKATRNNVSTSQTNEKKLEISFSAPNQTKRLRKRCFYEQNISKVNKNQEILLYTPSRQGKGTRSQDCLTSKTIRL